ncbi:MAG: hypothetical protein LBH41_00385 [Rickettsiales bacterium]|jgi:prolyl-tRNA synthetase|nr:hypothetical protein [Rickettsiales bacterium]
MRIENILSSRVRDLPADAVSSGHRLSLKGGFVHRTAAGIYTLGYLARKACANIEDIIRDELDSLGCQEIKMPVLSPESLWRESGRDGIDILLKFKTHVGADMVLNLSHEEVVVDYARAAVQSYRQLPFSLYQFQTKYRDELRPRAGLIRCREFTMKDAYSFHADEASLDETYGLFRAAYHRIYERIGLAGVVDAKASGGDMGGEYSHEFQWLNPVGEDQIFTCPSCGDSFNKEILSNGAAVCPKCGVGMSSRRGVEVGNIFRIGDKYTAPMKMRFSAADGSVRTPVMGCYGIGIGRAFACVLEQSGDEGRAVFNAAVAPFKVHVVSIGRDAGTNGLAESLYKELLRLKVDAVLDATDAAAGSKFAEADLIGAPIRAVFSPRNVAAGRIEMKYSGVPGGEEFVPLSTPAEKIRDMLK